MNLNEVEREDGIFEHHLVTIQERCKDPSKKCEWFISDIYLNPKRLSLCRLYGLKCSPKYGAVSWDKQGPIVKVTRATE